MKKSDICFTCRGTGKYNLPHNKGTCLTCMGMGKIPKGFERWGIARYKYQQYIESENFLNEAMCQWDNEHPRPTFDKKVKKAKPKTEYNDLVLKLYKMYLKDRK